MSSIAQITLTATERDTLIDVLKSTVSDLGLEIAGTDKMEFREGLKRKRVVLNRILDALNESGGKGAG